MAMSQPWSISARLTVLTALAGFTILLASGLVLYWVLASSLDQRNTQFLADKVFVLRAVLRERPNERKALEEETQLEGAARRFNRYYVRILDEQRRPIIATPGMDQAMPPKLFPEPVSERRVPEHAVETELTDRKVAALVSAWARVGTNGPPRLVQAALDLTDDEAVLTTYRRNLALMLIAGLAASTWAGRAIARRSLSPLNAITQVAREITAAHLDARVSSSAWPPELTALALAFDEMLSRLQNSFGRLSQFSADIAHELRTPLTNFLTEAQVTLSRLRAPGEYAKVLESGIEEFSRLARMIDTLLFLARAEEAPTLAIRDLVDVRREVEVLMEFHRADAEERGVALHCIGNALLRVDPTLMQRAISNLLSNAVRHTPHSGTVTITLSEAADGRGTICVGDTGCGIAREHLPHIFDRFYRPDSSRTQQTGGFGLGLALVKSIVELHGGDAQIESEPGMGTQVTLIIPPRALAD